MVWPALTWPGQSGTFGSMSTGGLNQRDVSPCTFLAERGPQQGADNQEQPLQPTGNQNNEDYEYDEVYEMVEGTNRRANVPVDAYYVGDFGH